MHTPSSSRFLLFDPRVVGHHVEFLEHAARYSAAQSDIQVHLVVHPHIEEHAPALVQLASTHSNCVFLHPLTESEFKATERTDTIFSRSLAGWKAAATRARRVEADHCVFMEMNAYQPVLGFPQVRRAPFQTSGILFFPYCRIETQDESLRTTLRIRMEKLRKHITLRWVLSNPKVHSIFLLNDLRGTRNLSEALQSDVFAALPDPVPPLSDTADIPSHVTKWANEKWPVDRTHFLLFGSLREAKGVRPALEAFQHLKKTEARAASLHVLGHARDDLRRELPTLVDRLRRRQPELHIHFENRYLSDTELTSALDRTDTVIVPYLRTEGSSGVLGHAANYRCPVIGPSSGLIGELIETYELGTSLPEITSSTLTRAVRAHLNDSSDVASETGMAQYVAERAPEAFARVLFRTLQGKTCNPMRRPK